MSVGARTGKRLACAAFAAAAWLGSPGPARAQCEAWPGEPAPLPTVSDPDSARARWAELRVADLAVRAERLEPEAPLESQRLWRRALCLDPDDPRAQAGMRRALGVRVHRPRVVWGAPARALADPWQLAAAIAVAPPAPGPGEAAAAPELARAAELLEASQASLARARFEEALGRAFEARGALEQAGPGDAADALRVQVAVAAATAQLALGDEPGAHASLGEALALEPALALDPARTSPKVLRALEQARAAAGSPR
jgi:hypothetical protein